MDLLGGVGWGFVAAQAQVAEGALLDARLVLRCVADLA